MKEKYIELAGMLKEYQSYGQAANLDLPKAATATPQLPISEEEYIMRKMAEAFAPRAADINVPQAAVAMPYVFETTEQYLMRKINECGQPQAASLDLPKAARR